MSDPEVRVPVIRPTLPALADVEAVVRDAWASGVVTLGATVKAFEAEARQRAGVRHAVALSSCTAGLMLVLQALELPRGGEVIVPSFTFAATAQALVWNGLVPVFCDSLPGTCTLDPEDVERNLTSRTVAICPVYTYGLPPDIEPLLALGRRQGVPVYFDSAQGLGASYQGRAAGGFGRCEVFSLSPTKVVTAVEGGLVTTDDDALAARLRSLRDYGKDPRGGEDMLHLGLSARMDDLHAAVGLLSLRRMDELVAARHRLIAVYRQRLGALPGCRVQAYPPDRATSGNYFVLFVSDGARRSRDELYEALKVVGIQTKRYFHPPVHEQTVFRSALTRVSAQLTQTTQASREALALPLYSHMTDDEIDLVCGHVEKVLG